MALRWISDVPAGMRRLRATRNSFSSGESCTSPTAPRTCTAVSATRKNASSLITLIRLISRGASRCSGIANGPSSSSSAWATSEVARAW